MVIRPDDLGQLAGVGAADNGKRDKVIVVPDELGDAAARGHRVNVDIGVSPLPRLQPVGEFVSRSFDPVGPLGADSEHRKLVQLCFSHRLVDDDVAMRRVVERLPPSLDVLDNVASAQSQQSPRRPAAEPKNVARIAEES